MYKLEFKFHLLCWQVIKSISISIFPVEGNFAFTFAIEIAPFYFNTFMKTTKFNFWATIKKPQKFYP